MAKAKTETTTEITTEITKQQSFAAFEQLLTVQRDVVEQIETAGGNSVAIQVAKLQGFERLKDAFTEAALPAVLALAGTPIGFRTDKDIAGGGCEYSPAIVRDVVLSALMEGLELFGNQFNILVGRLYTTNEGYDFKLSLLPQVTDIDVTAGHPENCDLQEAPSNNGQYTVFTVYGFVPVIVSFKLFGQSMQLHNTKTAEIDSRFLVSASGKDKLKTVDSLKAKAEKRAKARLYNFAKTATAGETFEPVATEPRRIQAPAEPETVAVYTGGEWLERFEQHGVVEPAKLIRDAPTAADRESVIAAARKQDYSAEALALLEEYAATKAERRQGKQ